MPHRVLVRADASSLIGTGHIIRTTTLAAALKDKGAEVVFVCRALSGNLIDFVKRQGFDVRSLPVQDELASGYQTDVDWLGTTQEEDARQTLTALGREERWDWIIVDHYGLDAEWEGMMRRRTHRIMVIDDLANRQHDCDLLLDQNYATNSEARYSDLLPGDCDVLLGPRYALLKPDYARARASMPARGEVVGRALVFFGGAANRELVAMALEALTAPNLRNLHVDLVVGAATNIDLKPYERPGVIDVHYGLPHLADLMARADIAIGAGGATTWERMCMGLPSIVVSVAENQRPACDALARDGLICYVGPEEHATADRLRALTDDIIGDGERRRAMTLNGMDMVDGSGVSRVVDSLTR